VVGKQELANVVHRRVPTGEIRRITQGRQLDPRPLTFGRHVVSELAVEPQQVTQDDAQDH